MAGSRHSDWIAAARMEYEAANRLGGSSELDQLDFASRIDSGRLAADAIPGYEIRGEIHRGGQGVVYHAIQKSTGQSVAIKVLREGPFAAPHDRLRFEREVHALARMRHPNIVGVIDGGSVSGSDYFVMDFVEGVRLDEYLRSVRTPERRDAETREIVEIFAKIAEAVSAAHLRGFIHRDLKPGNILIVSDDDRMSGAARPGRTPTSAAPRILDFGLAKPIDAPEAGGSSAAPETRTGHFVGSLPWASPEQAAGAAEQLDVRTDVYSLGVMLYEALTGQFPYPVTGELRQVLNHIATREPAPPRRIVAGVDDELETIVLKCLAKQPARRYQGAGELARDLRHYLAGEPIDAKRDSRGYLLRKLLARHRAAVAAAALIAALLATATVVSVSLWRQAVSERHRAEANARKASSEALKSGAISSFLQEMLAAANPANTPNPRLTVREALESAEQKLDSGSLAGQPAVETKVRETIGSTYLSLGLFAEAGAQFEKSLELIRQSSPGDSEDAARLLMWMSDTLAGQGAYTQAEASAREALAMYRRLMSGPSDEVAGCLNGLAIIRRTLGDAAEAETLYREALQIATQLHGAESEHAATALHNLAGLAAGRGQLDEAETMHRQILAIRRRVLGPDHPSVAFSLNSLATVLQQKRQLAESEALYRECIDLRRRILGEEHPDLATSLSDLGLLLDAQGRFQEAIAEHREALNMRRGLLGSIHPDTAVSMNNLALALFHQRDYDASEALYREALESLRRTFGDEHEYVARCLWNLADVLEAKGDEQAMETTLRQMVRVRTRLHGERNLRVANVQVRLGLCQLRQGKPADAEVVLRKCLKTREALLPPGDWLIDSTRSALGEALAAQEKYAEAEPLLVSSAEHLAMATSAPAERVQEAQSRLQRFRAAHGVMPPATEQPGE